MEQINKDSLIELAVAAHIGAPDVDSRAEIANMLRIREGSAHTDDEGRLLWEAQKCFPSPAIRGGVSRAA